jgi:hypothetical protein
VDIARFAAITQLQGPMRAGIFQSTNTPVQGSNLLLPAGWPIHMKSPMGEAAHPFAFLAKGWATTTASIVSTSIGPPGFSTTRIVSHSAPLEMMAHK